MLLFLSRVNIGAVKINEKLYLPKRNEEFNLLFFLCAQT